MILGSTGSIGTQALDLVRANPDRFRVVGLTVGGTKRKALPQVPQVSTTLPLGVAVGPRRVYVSR